MKTESRIARAFRDPLNWIGGALVAGGAYLLTLAPVTALVAWTVYEALYLLVVPQTGWFTRRAGRAGASDAAAASLPAEDRGRYAELSRLRDEIAAGLPGGSTWNAQIVGHLDGLREQFLRFARKRCEYQALLHGLAHELGAAPLDPFGQPLPPRGRERALATADVETLVTWIREGAERRLADAERQCESDAESQSLVERKRDLTQQLRTTAEEIGRAARNVERQLDLVDDSFRLIHARFRSQPPEQLISQVDEVLRSSHALSDALAELAPLEEQIQRLGRG